LKFSKLMMSEGWRKFGRYDFTANNGQHFHFPTAFNSSPVLPPCLRRRSAVSGFFVKDRKI
jgi:hypothetical protein